ncbi:MAG: hypothetical protein K5644_03180 [Lachnospiraceae bacterium]|nr:hypothetical protein [Lachnospiraceae bacterium]
MVEMNFRVSEIFHSSDSDDSRRHAVDNRKPLQRDSSSEFGSIFKAACDEVNSQASNTHQNRGYVPKVSASWQPTVLIK